MTIRGILFDVDDTLFDYTASEAAGLLALLREDRVLDRFPEPAAAVALWRSIMEEEYARFTSGELTLAAQQRNRAHRFLAHLGRTGLPDADAVAWFARYDTHRRAAWSAFPDAEPALRALAPGYRLGVVSNAAAHVQRRKLGALGLLPYVAEVFVCSQEHGAAKPAASIFHAACDGLGLPPHEVAYVGDNYAMDALGAHGAGLRAFWLNRSGAPIPPEPVVETLATLAALPAALAARPDQSLRERSS
ncbi:HAD family hydrolase [Nocardia thailandica]